MDHGIANELFTKVLSRTADSSKSKPGLFGLLSDYSITLTNLLFSAVVVGLELLLSSKFFDCPLNNHVLYGVLFLVSPFFIVLIMNVLLVGNPWDITDRCCISRYRRRGRGKYLSGEWCYWVCPNVTKACVGPCVWLIASFADTEYVVCAAVGQDIEKRNLTNLTEIKQLEAEFADAKAWSHILAWIAFLVLVTGTAIVITVKKCCLKDNVLLEDEYNFERREAIAALVTFRHFINGGPGNQQANPDPATTRSENESDTREDQDEKEVDNREVVPPPGLGPIAASSLSARGAAGGESNSDSTTIARESGETDGKGKNEDNKADGTISWFKKLLGVKQDNEKNKESDGEQGIVGRFMGREEKITLYPKGIPEQKGKEWIEDRFKVRGEKSYLKVYKDFEQRYPRFTRGRPWDPLVKP